MTTQNSDTIERPLVPLVSLRVGPQVSVFTSLTLGILEFFNIPKKTVRQDTESSLGVFTIIRCMKTK